MGMALIGLLAFAFGLAIYSPRFCPTGGCWLSRGIGLSGGIHKTPYNVRPGRPRLPLLLPQVAHLLTGHAHSHAASGVGPVRTPVHLSVLVNRQHLRSL